MYKFLSKMLPAPEYYAIATTAVDWVAMDIVISQSLSSLALFDILFRCIDRCNQSYSDFPAKIFQPFKFSSWENVGFVQQQQPVTCFIGFFQGNLQLGNKISLTLSILGFVDIGSDTGSGSADLITDDRFVLAFKIFDKV